MSKSLISIKVEKSARTRLKAYCAVTGELMQDAASRAVINYIERERETENTPRKYRPTKILDV